MPPASEPRAENETANDQEHHSEQTCRDYGRRHTKTSMLTRYKTFSSIVFLSQRAGLFAWKQPVFPILLPSIATASTHSSLYSYFACGKSSYLLLRLYIKWGAERPILYIISTTYRSVETGLQRDAGGQSPLA